MSGKQIVWGSILFNFDLKMYWYFFGATHLGSESKSIRKQFG